MTNVPYAMPIELRVNKHPGGYYTVDKVYSGVDNVSYGQRKFMTRADVSTYCKTEWPGVPVISN